MLTESSPYGDLFPDRRSEDIFEILAKLHRVALGSVTKSLPSNAVLSYSGGVDSSILNQLIQEAGNSKIQLVRLGVLGSSDARNFRTGHSKSELANTLEFVVSRNEVEQAAKEVSEIVRVKNLSHFEDCMCFWLIGKKVQSNTNAEFIVSANGPDELYCGYDRFRRILDSQGYSAVEREIMHALDMADSLRNEVKLVLSKLGLESCEPLLSQDFRSFSTRDVAVELKIAKGDDRVRKRIWRALGRNLGISEERVLQPKKAMQYSMGIHQIMLSLLKTKSVDIDFESQST